MNRNVNEKLARVGPGTPMGEVLRRNWHPVAAIAELERYFERIGRSFPPSSIFQAGQPDAVRSEHEAAMGRPVTHTCDRLDL